VSNKLSTLFSSFRGFPVGRRTKGNTENDGSEDPENWEQKPILEHVHGKGGRFLWPGFLVPPGVSREIFPVVRGRGDITP